MSRNVVVYDSVLSEYNMCTALPQLVVSMISNKVGVKKLKHELGNVSVTLDHNLMKFET